MPRGVGFAVVLLAVFWITSTESLECFSCSNIQNTSDCLAVAKCSVDEQCFTDARGTGNSTVFTLGCKGHALCLGSTTQIPISIVGRQVTERKQSTGCQQCCGTDYCNKKICIHSTEIITSTTGQCMDDPDYNCELISGTFNICGDVHHAKTVCRKWCGLCTLVDGSWSSWSTWSNCDLTCGNGSTSRTRKCDNPAPSSGGLPCAGDNIAYAACQYNACPVHGGWSIWSEWGSCSVTCGVGLKRRDRSCSNPYPDSNGNPCFGDAGEDRVCFVRACADGGWSTWSNWGNCSATCNGGIRARTRPCDNPSPSTFGRDCVGNNENIEMCNTVECPGGGWSTWSNWGSCSATCNGGIRARTRVCDNPSPSTFGRGCVGNNEHIETCNTIDCPANHVAFSITSPNHTMVNGVPIFTDIVTNVGGGYDAATGKFTCPVAGLYHFSVTLYCLSSPYVYCSLTLNGNRKGVCQAYAEHDTGTLSMYFVLQKGDFVNLGQCKNWNNVYTGDYTVFSGALVN